MEEKKQFKNELGHIYGSRISKNGKWLNLSITTIIDGQQWRITCPVRMGCNAEDGKPVAVVEGSRAEISSIPVYQDAKPKQGESADMGDLPF